MGNKTMILVIIRIILDILLADFAIIVGLVVLICWTFGIAFNWKFVISIFYIMLLIPGIISSARSNKLGVIYEYSYNRF